MSRSALQGSLLVASLAFGALGPEAARAAEGGMKDSGAVAPTGEAKALLEKVKDYKSWPTFPDATAPKLSKGHGGLYVLAYHNDVVGQAVASHALPLPDGSIIVKENRPQADAAPAALSIMSKQGGGWYWLQATPDGKVVTAKGKPMAGAVKGCAGCHSQASDNDQVYTYKFAR